MKILSLILLSFVISAATEIETDCETLGYELISDDSSFQETCESWLVCPANTNYKICTKKKTEYIYTENTCPNGATCEQEDKYRLIGCDTANGYVEYDNGCCKPNDCSGYNLTMTRVNSSATYSSCSPGCGDSTTKYKVESCAEGYEVNSDNTACISTCDGEASCPTGYLCTECTKDGTKLYTNTGKCGTGYAEGKQYQGDTAIDTVSLCYSTSCKTDTAPAALYVDSYIYFDNGGYVIKSCKSTAKTITDANGCITCSLPSCSDCGFYDSSTAACASVGDSSDYIWTIELCDLVRCYDVQPKSTGGAQTGLACGSLGIGVGSDLTIK